MTEKEKFGGYLLNLAFQEAVLMVPGQMTDRQRDWIAKMVSIMEAQTSVPTADELDELDDDALLGMLYDNLDNGQKDK